MLGRHVVLVGTTAILFVLGLSIGFNDTHVEAGSAQPVKCGSLLAPHDTAASFKREVAGSGTVDTSARAYAERCEELRASRHLPTYSAVGLGVVGLFASSVIFGRNNRQFLTPQ